MEIIVIIAIVFAIPLILALFFRKDFVIEKEIIINRPKNEVFNYIRYLKNQEHYSKWASIDPDIKWSYKGTDGTVGFVSVWKSDNKNVGKSEHEIKNIQDGERIDIEIRFTEPFKSTDPAYMITESVAGNQTRLRSGYIGKMNYPMNLALPMIIKKVGSGIETGLVNLKTILEK